MREILFRGKRIDNGAWETGGVQIGNPPSHKGEAFIIDTVTNYLTPVDIDTIGQFTGRLDTNGKPIFEGDLVILQGSIYLVTWWDWGAGLVLDMKSSATRIMFDEWGDTAYFIVGNIHDNPILPGKAVITNPDYWDCECDDHFIHRKADGLTCPACGATESDGMPDSRQNEIDAGKYFFKGGADDGTR